MAGQPKEWTRWVALAAMGVGAGPGLAGCSDEWLDPGADAANVTDASTSPNQDAQSPDESSGDSRETSADTGGSPDAPSVGDARSDPNAETADVDASVMDIDAGVADADADATNADATDADAADADATVDGDVASDAATPDTGADALADGRADRADETDDDALADGNADAAGLDARLPGDSASETPTLPCAADAGGIVEGSYQIRNSIDVALLQPYCEVTGDITVAAVGLTNITLPLLRKIGGRFVLEDAPNLVTLAMPALESVQLLDARVDSLAHLLLPSLRQTPDIAVGGFALQDLDLSMLKGPTTLAVALSATSPSTVDLHALDNGSVSFNGGDRNLIANIDLSSFVGGSSSILQFYSHFLLPDGYAVPALVSADTLAVCTTASAIRFPNLTTLGSLTICDSGPGSGPSSIELSSLQTVNTITVSSATLGSLSLPSVPQLASLSVTNSSMLATVSLPVLRTAGDITVSDNAALGTLSLPALQTANLISVTNDAMLGSVSLGSLQHASKLVVTRNPALTSVEAPNLASVDLPTIDQCWYNPNSPTTPHCCEPPTPALQIYRNPMLPTASGASLLAQVGYSVCPAACTMPTACGITCGNLGDSACPFP